MLYCPKCKVNIRGSKKCCPLCKGDLTGESEKAAFPVVEPGINQVSVAKILTFIAVVAVVTMLMIWYFTRAPWTIFVIPLCAIGWIDSLLALYHRYNLIRLITVETYIGMLICFLIDRKLGFNGWSLKWAIPGAFIGLFLATLLIGVLTKGLRLEDCIIYLIFDVLMSLLQLIGIFTGANTLPLPALVSVAVLFLAGVALLLFRFRDLKNASGKWFNV